MPELPEVETIRNNLTIGSLDFPPLVGMELKGSLLLWDRTLATPSSLIFFSKLPGQTIETIDRRGKYLIFRLSRDFLLFHLRMSGDLVLEDQSKRIDKHCRLALFLEEDWRLTFNDTRKFGRVWMVDDPLEVVGDLGPEPLDPDFTSEKLYSALKKHRRQIKPLLMDQHFLAGLGNIYTDEALHHAKIHPLTRSNDIPKRQVTKLLKSIQKALQDGIAKTAQA